MYLSCARMTNLRLSLAILLFFLRIFLSCNSFLSYLFCSLSSYFSTHKMFFLQLLSMHDCCIRVIHRGNMVTALLEYLKLLAVFPEANVELILHVCDYSSIVSPS